MLRVSQLLQVIHLKKALRIPMNEGACFGVHSPKELRPPFNLPETAAINKKKDGEKK